MPWLEKEFKVSEEKEKREVINRLFNYLSEYAYENYIFRGHSSCRYKLESSLIREPYLTENRLEKLELIEEKMKAKFESEAYLYSEGKDYKVDNNFQTLAIMQHYGTPTRLLDWTYSPYVALYFSSISNLNEDSSIYCLDLDHIEFENRKINDEIKTLYSYIPGRSSKERIEDVDEIFECKKNIIKNENNIISNKKLDELRGKNKDQKQLIRDRINDLKNMTLLEKYEPKQKNLRIVRQHGLFMVSDKINSSYNEILKTYNIKNGKIENIKDSKEVAIKILIGKELKKDILKKLEFMNISNKILFPGIEGFCEGIKYGI